MLGIFCTDKRTFVDAFRVLLARVHVTDMVETLWRPSVRSEEHHAAPEPQGAELIAHTAFVCTATKVPLGQ